MLMRLRKLVAPKRPGELVRCDSGLALVEFAFSLPILLTLGLAGLETANYAMAHLRVRDIASTTADNAASVRESIDEADVRELFTGSILSGASIDFEANGRIILSTLEPSSDGERQWIRWQRCAGDLEIDSSHGRPLDQNGSPIVDGTEVLGDDGRASTNPSSEEESEMTGVTVQGVEIAAQSGTAVMVAEAVYVYQPLMANALTAGTQIRYVSAYNVRQRTNQLITNNGDNDPASCG